jgi:triacylglycerol esterase/lipase EstA (alpha/beta hydrolase family)
MVLGQSIALAVDRVLAPIEGMHLTISRGWFAAAGHPGSAVRRGHDAISNVAYGSVRVGAAVLGGVVSHRFPQKSQIALKGQAIVNGLWGDDLGTYENDLGISMTLRSAVGDVVTDGTGLMLAPPDATPHLVVLVHGLFESEFCWNGDESASGLIEALEKRSHLTVLTTRYNSGRRISDNGEQLAAMLEDLCFDWPVPVESIVLVGNSMGGLLVRSACAVAESKNHKWLVYVSDIVTVAAPHQGTPIETGVDALSSALSLAASTRPLGRFLDSRSQGIRDLRHGGAAVDGDRSVQGIDQHFIAAVVTPEPGSPVGAVIGDLVVQPSSASMGGCQSTANVTYVGGTNHFKAVSSPAVIDRVLECLDARH